MLARSVLRGVGASIFGIKDRRSLGLVVLSTTEAGARFGTKMGCGRGSPKNLFSG
jgi:hypothetical protein